MADVHIVREHQMGLAGARAVALVWAAQAEHEFGLQCVYEQGLDADRVCFSRAGVRGQLQVSASRFELDAQLGFLLGAFKDRIHSEIAGMLNLLTQEPSAPAERTSGKPARKG